MTLSTASSRGQRLIAFFSIVFICFAARMTLFCGPLGMFSRLCAKKCSSFPCNPNCVYAMARV